MATKIMVLEDEVIVAVETQVRLQELHRTKEALEQIVEERTRALEEEKRNLAETNAALKTLLRQQEEDREELQESILSNMQNLVRPYLEKLKGTVLTEEQKTYMDILETHLYEITSPFANRLSQNHLRLTPVEFQVARMVREGTATREIAQSLNLAESTIRTHRENLRRKLNILGKKINLRSFLQSFQ